MAVDDRSLLTTDEALAAVVDRTLGPDVVETYADAVTAIIDHHYGPAIQEAADRTEYLNGASARTVVPLAGPLEGLPTVWVRTRPVYSWTSVTEYDRGGTGTALTAETHDTKPSAGYRAQVAEGGWYTGELERRTDGDRTAWESGEGNIAVVYRAGRFADRDAVPFHWKQAARHLLQYLIRAQQTSVGEVGEYSVPAQSYPTYDDLPNVVRTLLAGQRRNRRGFA